MQSLYRPKLFLALYLLFPLLLLVVACGPSAGTSAPEEVSVAVNFAGDKLTPNTVQVKQGDMVTLRLDTDKPGTFHLHGYDLEKSATVGAVTDFQFVADATGRFRITFHGAVDSPENQDHASASAMAHGPVESSVPIAIDLSAEVEEDGGVHVNIVTEGWRWAPEEVNLEPAPGAGHAHIYTDGVKLSRVYGPHYYLPGLEQGMCKLRVALNDNSHNALTFEGNPAEATAMVTIPAAAAMNGGHHDNDTPDPVAAESPMSLELFAHPDPLGGYNLQVIPAGFTFAEGMSQVHVPGQGYAELSINGEKITRLYGPWLQARAQGDGRHTFTVALLTNGGKPYHHNGQPVAATIEVYEEAESGDIDAGIDDTNHILSKTGSLNYIPFLEDDCFPKTGNILNQGAFRAVPKSMLDQPGFAMPQNDANSGNDDQGHHSGGDTKNQKVGGHHEQKSTTEESVELEVGFLEVLPR